MKSRNHITAFYLEALLLIAVFICIILVLTNVFGAGIIKSGDAEALTGSVTLAQNACEMASASSDGDELYGWLNEEENARILEGDVFKVEARYDEELSPDKDGKYILEISWEPEDGDREGLVRNKVSVRLDGFDEPVYSLETAVYLKEVRS